MATVRFVRNVASPIFLNDNRNGFQFVFCFGKFEVIFVEQVDCIRDSNGYNYRRNQSAEQGDLESKKASVPNVHTTTMPMMIMENRTALRIERRQT